MTPSTFDDNSQPLEDDSWQTEMTKLKQVVPQPKPQKQNSYIVDSSDSDSNSNSDEESKKGC